MEIGFDTVSIITSDPFKLAVGGIPRNSLLVMIPSITDSIPPHFTLLRVLESAPTPLSAEVQQTYFELQKKSMPELDIFTQSELQWGALKTAVLGMFYPNPDKHNAVEFSGDLNNFVSAHKYRVYSPNDAILDLIVNTMVPSQNRFQIGKLRLTECRLPLPDKTQPDVNVHVSTKDFMGARTAMFGKTRLGKSNIVKLIAQSLIETTDKEKNVGQVVFDINGEYANDNPQDDNLSLAGVYPKRCVIYALTKKTGTVSKPLKLNFYEHANNSLKVLADLLKADKRGSIYINAFLGSDIPSLEYVKSLPIGEQLTPKRRLLMYWAILKKAGYQIDEVELARKLDFNPRFTEDLRKRVYGTEELPDIKSLADLIKELEKIAAFVNKVETSKKPEPEDEKLLLSSSGNPLFERDERSLLGFLSPSSGAGPAVISPYRIYHDKNAENFFEEIVKHVDAGETVIIDLGNANKEVMRYFSENLSEHIINHQVGKFTNNKLGNHFVQLYFEEAHDLFPAREEDTVDVYRRLAKEGAKYHIGMVYSTQSVTTINKDLLAQTENFFIAHMSSQDEVNALGKVNIAYENLKPDILQSKTPGYVRMLTRSHRFVIPVQAARFSPNK